MNKLTTARVLFGSLFCAQLFLAPLLAISIEEINAGVRERFKSLDQVAVDFHVKVYRFEDDLDPWDSDNWRELGDDLCQDFSAKSKLLAPSSFLLELESNCSLAKQEREDKYGWHERELRVLGGIGTPNLGGMIKSEHTAGLLMTDHAFTPLGFRFFEREENLLQIIDKFSMSIVGEHDGAIDLRGELVLDRGKQVAEISVAPDQAFIMTEAKYTTLYEDEGEYKLSYEFAYRLLETSDFGEFTVPKRACYYTHNPQVMPMITLREWKLDSIESDSSIDSEMIMFDFPPGAWVTDQIRRKAWLVGEGGEHLEEEDLPEGYESRSQADIDAHAAADAIRSNRRGVLPFIGGGALLITILILVLRRPREV